MKQRTTRFWNYCIFFVGRVIGENMDNFYNERKKNITNRKCSLIVLTHNTCN